MKQIEIEKIFGKFDYENNANGSITILGDWTKKNIVKVVINNKTLWVHRLLLKQIHFIVRDLRSLGKLHLFDFSNGGGCFVARHKCWKLSRKLSCHSWAIAIDLNPKKYPYGTDKNPPKVVINIFKRWGFIHGGDWRSKDGMHFQWRKFI